MEICKEQECQPHGFWPNMNQTSWPSAWQLPSFTHFVYILHKIMDYTLTKIVQLFTITPFVIHFIFAKGSKT